MDTPTKEIAMLKKYLVQAIGVGAFIIGGLVAQDKALEVVETIKKAFQKAEPTS